MATEFPVDPEYGRFVDGQQQEPQEGVEVDMPEMDDAELEELPDGSVVVTLDTKGPMDDEDFYTTLPTATILAR